MNLNNGCLRPVQCSLFRSSGVRVNLTRCHGRGYSHIAERSIASVAGIATRHNLHPKVVQKWRLGHRHGQHDSFIRLPARVSLLDNRPAKAMLLASDHHEDLIDAEGFTVSLLLSLRSSSVQSFKIDAFKPNRLSADGDSAFRYMSSISRRLRLKR